MYILKGVYQPPPSGDLYYIYVFLQILVRISCPCLELQAYFLVVLPSDSVVLVEGQAIPQPTPLGAWELPNHRELVEVLCLALPAAVVEVDSSDHQLLVIAV